jgi:predicted transporter
MIYYFIFGLVIFAVYKIISFVKVPTELKNTPTAPLLAFFRLILDKRCVRDKTDKYLQSYFNEFGVIKVNLTRAF